MTAYRQWATCTCALCLLGLSGWAALLLAQIAAAELARGFTGFVEGRLVELAAQAWGG